MDRGITGLNGRGMYTNRKRNTFLCGFSKEIFQLKEIVRDIDPRAFVIVGDVRKF